MSDHNESFSSSGYDMSLVYMCEHLALPYKEFDVLIKDIDEAELKKIGRCYEVEHLSEGSFRSPAFPVTGRIYSRNVRFMIPLVCQWAKKSDKRVINVWFLVESGSPYTCLTKTSLKKIFGDEKEIQDGYFYSIAIQDQNSIIQCQVSKDHFREVNILGVDAMQQLRLSTIVDWDHIEFELVKSANCRIVHDSFDKS